MKRITLPVFLFAIFLAMPALALGLQEARGGGLVGEKADGYIAAVKPSAEVNALVASVNAARKEEYAKISKANGQPVDIVAKLAAEEIINKLAPGSLYQDNGGTWKKR